MAVTAERRLKRASKVLLVSGLGSVFAAGAWLTPASAQETDMTFAKARFLSGSVLGTDLDNIVALEGAEAANTGSDEAVTEANPLELSVLGNTLIDVPGGIQVPLSDIVKLGAVNQYATAEANGVAGGGAGAVADNGAIGTGTDAGFPANAELHLADLLGEGFTEAIADVNLLTEDVSAEAHAAGSTTSTDYKIAELDLEVAVPLVKQLVSAMESETADVENTIDTMAGPEGAITKALNTAAPVTSLTGSLGVGVDVSAALDVDLSGTIAHLCDNPLGEDTPVEIDLCEGTVTVDLDSLTDGAISDMPANTEVLSQEVIDAIAENTGEILDNLVEDAVELVEAAVLDSELNVHIAADASVAGSVDLRVQDTLRNVLNGDAVVIDNSTGLTAAASGLLAPAVDAVVPTIGGVVEEKVTGAAGAVPSLGKSIAELVDDLTDVLDPALDQLNEVLSVKVNAQDPEIVPMSAGSDASAVSAGFLPSALPAQASTSVSANVTAIQVVVLNGDGATINLSQVIIGATGDGGPGDDGDGGDDGGDNGDGGDDGALPDTGSSTPGWLLPLGLVLIVVGGTTAFVVNRRQRLFE